MALAHRLVPRLEGLPSTLGQTGETITDTRKIGGSQKEFLARKEDIMTTIKAFIKRRPVLTYFTLTYGISWGGSLAETLWSITELGQPAIAGTSPLSRTS